jgi:hypothetical protein
VFTHVYYKEDGQTGHVNFECEYSSWLENSDVNTEESSSVQYVQMYVYIYIHVYTYMYVYIYIYIYIHTHTHTCVCVCVYMYIYIYTRERDYRRDVT